MGSNTAAAMDRTCVAAVRNASLAPAHRSGENRRTKTTELLSEMAYVFHLTRDVKRSILERTGHPVAVSV